MRVDDSGHFRRDARFSYRTNFGERCGASPPVFVAIAFFYVIGRYDIENVQLED